MKTEKGQDFKEMHCSKTLSDCRVDRTVHFYKIVDIKY